MADPEHRRVREPGQGAIDEEFSDVGAAPENSDRSVDVVLRTGHHPARRLRSRRSRRGGGEVHPDRRCCRHIDRRLVHAQGTAPFRAACKPTAAVGCTQTPQMAHGGECGCTHRGGRRLLPSSPIARRTPSQRLNPDGDSGAEFFQGCQEHTGRDRIHRLGHFRERRHRRCQADVAIAWVLSVGER